MRFLTDSLEDFFLNKDILG